MTRGLAVPAFVLRFAAVGAIAGVRRAVLAPRPRRPRARLADLDAHLLRDIGLTRANLDCFDRRAR